MRIAALDPADTRQVVANVATPAALLVAKLHKLGEREQTPERLLDKDAHDSYRLLVATSTAPLARSLDRLMADELAGPATRVAVDFLERLFAAGPGALGSAMAGRAEHGVGDPAVVSASVAALAADLLAALSASR